MPTPTCLCQTPGIVLPGPCPICTAPTSWKDSPAAQRKARAARAPTSRGNAAARTPASLAPIPRPAQAPRVLVCGAPHTRYGAMSVHCNLNAGHSGPHLAIGGATWSDAVPAPLSPPPVLKSGAAPQVVAEDERTDPGAPSWDEPTPPVPAPAPAVDGAALLAELLEDPVIAPRPEVPARPTPKPVQAPPPAPVASDLEWDRIPAAARPAVLAMIRAGFDLAHGGDLLLGVFRVVVISSRARVASRKAELSVLDFRATVDGATRRKIPANADDQHKLHEILGECISELGFDPRTQDAPGQSMPDGKALLNELIGA